MVISGLTKRDARWEEDSKETWVLAGLNHLELRMGSKIDVNPTRKMKYHFSARLREQLRSRWIQYTLQR